MLVHNTAYSDNKDLAKITISDNILEDRAYEIAMNLKYDGYQRRLASMVCKFFDKKKNREWFKWGANSRFTNQSL